MTLADAQPDGRSLRSAGEITSGPKPFAQRDRSAFLSALDQAIVRLTREGFGKGKSRVEKVLRVKNCL